jgi:hypothetical protein
VHPSRLIVASLAVALAITACSPSSPTPAPTPAPTQVAVTTSAPTQAPAASPTIAVIVAAPQGFSPKAPGWDRLGKVSYTISGAVTGSGELGLLMSTSQLAGLTDTTLMYYGDNRVPMLGIHIDLDGLVLRFSDGTVMIKTPACKTTGVVADTKSATGSFECPGSVGEDATGHVIVDVVVKGTFTAKP